jgi:hypothetical protein
LGITEAIRTGATAATEVLFELPPLHLQLEDQTREGIYIDSIAVDNLCLNPKGMDMPSWGIKEEPLLHVVITKMMLRLVYGKSFMV